MQKYLGRGALREMPLRREWVDEALDSADVAIVTIGRQAGEGRDRAREDFFLTKQEHDMLQMVSDAVHARGKRMAVVLSLVAMVSLRQSLPA